MRDDQRIAASIKEPAHRTQFCRQCTERAICSTCQRLPLDALEKKRELVNKDLERKPAGVSESDWQQFRSRRMAERERILYDEAGIVGSVKRQLDRMGEYSQ